MLVKKIITPELESHSKYKFGVATDKTTQTELFRFRTQYYQESAKHLLKNNLEPGKDRYDENAYLMYLKTEGNIVATIRLLPHGTHSEIAPLLPCDIRVPHPESTLEISRFLIAQNYRKQKLYEVLFFHGLNWIFKYTPYRRYISICRESLVGFYQKMGSELLYPDGFNIPERRSSLYYCVGGLFQTAVNKLKNMRSKYD